MDSFFDSKLKKATIVVLSILAVFLLVKTVSTIIDLSKAPSTQSNFGHVTIYPEKTESYSITFNGRAHVKAVPDIATFLISVNKEAATVSEAQQKMAQQISEVTALLDGHQIDKKDIETRSYHTTPKYKYNKPKCVQNHCEVGKRVIDGYIAKQSLYVKLRDIKKAENILTALATLEVAGVSGPSFSISDLDKHKAQAKFKAIENAKKEAAETAKFLGVKLGKIIAFSEGNAPTHYARNRRGSAAFMAEDHSVNTKLETGEQKVSAVVSITYMIN